MESSENMTLGIEESVGVLEVEKFLSGYDWERNASSYDLGFCDNLMILGSAGLWVISKSDYCN